MAIEVYDIGPDKEFDRYTVIIDGAVFGMSENPLQPCGFNQYCGEVDNLPNARQGRSVDWRTLPAAVRNAIIKRLKEE